MNLAEVCDRLHEFDGESTIYAREPWTPASEAVVAVEPGDGGLPKTARHAGMTHLIEVDIAQDFLEGWRSNLTAPPTPAVQAQRLIQYAIHDA